MSDTELDREWKPRSTRPQSTMARSFSAALDDLFKLDDNSIVDLDAEVFKKKQAVSTQTSELEALEARLKATEERLKAAAISPGKDSSSGAGGSPRQRAPLGDTFSQAKEAERLPMSPLTTDFANKPSSRPATGNKPVSRPTSGWNQESGQAMPGGLPPTPGASEGEYVIIDLERTRADYMVIAKDGGSPRPHQ
ncbi:hypothetical protein PVAG01_00110 [Phlyctema vagabunda]|uniref:Uncharacterized protein n=1 Tax=Phlyctema vagabunda TaxID=108571 RepID=A0ABR4PTF0_9HELO